MRTETLAAALLILALLAVEASAAPSGLVLEWRAIIDENPPPGFTPVFLGPLAGGRYIAIIGVSSQAHTWLYLVDAATQSVARKIDLGPGKPLCVSRQDTSLSIMLDMGRGNVKERIVTPDLYVVEGIGITIDMPVILSGCSRIDNYYLVYGSEVTESRGLDAYAALIGQGGTIIAETSWGGPADEAVYLVAPANSSSAYAIVSNLSSPKNYTVYFLKISNNISKTYIRNITGITILDAAYNKTLLLASSLAPTNPALLIVSNPHNTRLIRLPEGSKILSIAGYEHPYAYLTGFAINTTTLLLDGLAMVVNVESGKIVASSIAVGKNNITLPVSLIIGDHLYAAGLHGNIPLLLSYTIEYTAPPTQTTESPPPGGGVQGRMTLYIIFILITIAFIVLAILLYTRKKR